MRKAINYLPALLLSIVAVPVQAVLIGPGDVVRVDFSTTAIPDKGGFDFIRYGLDFNRDIDTLHYQEGWTVSVYDSSGSRIGSTEFRNPFNHYGGTGSIDVGVAFDNPLQLTDGTGHMALTNIIGTFDLVEFDLRLAFYRPYGSTQIRPSQMLTVTHVPEPPASLLLLSGLLAVRAAQHAAQLRERFFWR